MSVTDTATRTVRTDELVQYVDAVEVRYGSDRDGTWSLLLDVRPSKFQGWEIVLAACTLQSCFADTPIAVREPVVLYGVAGPGADWVRANVGLN